jgi:sarcosine oxidase delta subunit
MPRPLLCPICKSPAVQELNRAGDAIGYHCATHSAFQVADTVFAEQRVKDYTQEQWEAALRKAKQRTKPGEWPVITSIDF